MYTVVTDGSACNRSRKGGWAAVVRNSTTLTELTGWAEETTSNRMELVAAVEALKSIPVPSKVTLVTDSAYLRNTMTRKWYENWFTEDKKRKRPNLDLWYQLDGLAKFHDITWVKVKGHSGDYWNTRVDVLAAWARTEQTEIANKMEVTDLVCGAVKYKSQCRLYAGHSGRHHYKGRNYPGNEEHEGAGG
jgi:ribonuclease HI